MALIIMAFRYIALIILYTIKNQSYLYLLKPVVYANLLCIPLCGILSVLIFSRNNRIKLKKILLLSMILFIAYFILIYKSPANINVSNICGYIIELQLQAYGYIILLIINSTFLFIGIKLYHKVYSSKLGAILIIMASSFTLISVLLSSIDSNFPMLLLGDLSWILTLNYGLMKFKR